MINRLQTGVFGLPRRGRTRGAAVGRIPCYGKQKGYQVVRYFARVAGLRSSFCRSRGKIQISDLICPKNTTAAPCNLHHIWNFL